MLLIGKEFDLARGGGTTARVCYPHGDHLDSHRLITDEEVVIVHHAGEVSVVAGDGKTKNIFKWTQ